MAKIYQYKYSDFVEINKENKKLVDTKVVKDSICFTVQKARIMEDKSKLKEDIEKYDNPRIAVSGQGLMYLSVLLDAVVTHRLAITNVSILKDCFLK